MPQYTNTAAQLCALANIVQPIFERKDKTDGRYISNENILIKKVKLKMCRYVPHLNAVFIRKH